MFNDNPECESLLKILGQRLLEARLSRNESQAVFAARLGISRQSYGKMEKGIPSVPLGAWLTASHILGLLHTWNTVLTIEDNLFEKFKQKQSKKKRASRKRPRDL